MDGFRPTVVVVEVVVEVDEEAVGRLVAVELSHNSAQTCPLPHVHALARQDFEEFVVEGLQRH